MSKVIAAVNGSAAARPVLVVAGEIARLVDAEVEAVHVREAGAPTPRVESAAAGVPLREIVDPTVESLIEVGRPADVEALVLGARRTAADGRPVGSTALEVITGLEKPLVVVPPDVAHPERLRRVLVPLDGTRETAEALRRTIELVHGWELDIVILHVHEAHVLPSFEDQPQHEVESWSAEFLARHCTVPATELTLELRIGAPHDYVVRVAEESGADLIALGWSQDLSAGRAEVVRATLSESRVPVLLLPVTT